MENQAKVIKILSENVIATLFFLTAWLRPKVKYPQSPEERLYEL